jgi:hypothetical protein
MWNSGSVEKVMQSNETVRQESLQDDPRKNVFQTPKHKI